VRRLPAKGSALAALALLAGACGGKSVDMSILTSPNDRVVWEAGEKALQKHDWSAARQYFKRIVDSFPQSERQPDARIAVADSYFDEGGTASYILAASTYKEFLTLYPQHPRSDYAQFRAAESHFKQRNTPDRDQTQTHKALEEYEKLLDIYPQSHYVEQTRDRIKECRQTLARSHYLVGYFYQRGRQAWRSALGRYETIINEFPDYDQLDVVLFHYAECLAASGRYAEALPQLARLEKEYPKSDYIDNAAKLRATFPPSFAPAVSPASAQGAAGHSTQPAPGTTSAPGPAVQGKVPASAGDAPAVSPTPEKPAPAPPPPPPPSH
jgi:outer membrane protein assembly factor BamD